MFRSRRARLPIVLYGLAALMLAAIAAAGTAAAQDQRQNAPGEFDYYVLSLSWSPSFCEAAAERGSSGRSQQAQCGERPFSFVVHGEDFPAGRYKVSDEGGVLTIRGMDNGARMFALTIRADGRDPAGVRYTRR